jgi:hypothetical protein
MHHSIIVSGATAMFLACFATAYLLLQAASAPLRALIGGGMFFLLAVLLLWKDGMRLKVPTERQGPAA